MHAVRSLDGNKLKKTPHPINVQCITRIYRYIGAHIKWCITMEMRVRANSKLPSSVPVQSKSSPVGTEIGFKFDYYPPHPHPPGHPPPNLKIPVLMCGVPPLLAPCSESMCGVPLQLAPCSENMCGGGSRYTLFLCLVHPQFTFVPWTLWLCLGFSAKLRIC